MSGLIHALRLDIDAALGRDPAARHRGEIVLLYPGFHAVALYRVAHSLWVGKHKMAARVVSALAYRWTQVDIHPGAVIGEGLFIDHASGVVIGETAVIGDDVTLYHQVTLGGRGSGSGKRHPTIGDRVIVGAGAKVLGPIVVGSDARIGANAVVVKEVPSGAVVVGVPGQNVARSEDRQVRKPAGESARVDGTARLQHASQGSSVEDSVFPDALGDGLRSLMSRVDEIETVLVGHVDSEGIRPQEDGSWRGEDFSI
jgi:serine O-acetyltransferase